MYGGTRSDCGTAGSIQTVAVLRQVGVKPYRRPYSDYGWFAEGPFSQSAPKALIEACFDYWEKLLPKAVDRL